MLIDEDKLLQTGLDVITKAFTIKKGNFKAKIKEQKLIIIDLQAKIEAVENQNDKMESEISILQLENHQLKKHNSKLQSLLNENQKKFTEIKTSLLDSTNNTQSINVNSEIGQLQGQIQLQQQHFIPHTQPKKEKGGKLTLNNVKNKILVKQLSNIKKKPSIDIPLNRNHNGFVSHRSNYSANIIEDPNSIIKNDVSINCKANANANDDNSRFNRIESKISHIKRNMTSRENSRNRVIEDRHSSTSNLRDNKNRLFTTINNSSSLMGDNKANYLTVNERHCFNDTYITSNEDDGYNNSSRVSEYKMKIDFLNKCNLHLAPKNFERILSLFERIKTNDIEANDAIPHIKKCLQNNTALLIQLDSVFEEQLR